MTCTACEKFPVGTRFIYVDGSDLTVIAPELVARIEAFVSAYMGRVSLVNQRAKPDPQSSDYPDWDLGVNFLNEALTNIEKRELILFFQILSGDLGRDFILGCVLASGQTQDLVDIRATDSIEKMLERIDTQIF